jgi:hypothetical protein
VGLELRNLPVPQLYTGNSTIFTAPSKRLSKEVVTYKDLENYMETLKILDTSVAHFCKLGEKYFPSVGLTPEQAYPYIITLSEANTELKWVKLRELYHNLEKIKDGHLLIMVVRLVHAIGDY